MADTALIVANNLSYNVSTRMEEAKTSLSHLATVYLVTEVAGQSQATVEAKRRDLQRFLTFYQTLYNHERPDEWFVSVTKVFLKALQQERDQYTGKGFARVPAEGGVIREFVPAASSSALASCKSAVSNPSVNQP